MFKFKYVRTTQAVSFFNYNHIRINVLYCIVFYCVVLYIACKFYLILFFKFQCTVYISLKYLHYLFGNPSSQK